MFRTRWTRSKTLAKAQPSYRGRAAGGPSSPSAPVISSENGENGACIVLSWLAAVIGGVDGRFANCWFRRESGRKIGTVVVQYNSAEKQ